MAFPNYGKHILAGFSEAPQSPVQRTEMEDGFVKESEIKSRVMVPRDVNYFFTLAEYANFKIWFKAEARGGLFFDWTDPIDGAVKQMRLVSSLYSTKFTSQGDGAELGAQVSFTLEGWES